MTGAERLRWVRRRFLSIDRGSSSLKTMVYEFGPAGERLLVKGGVEAFGASMGALHLRERHRSVLREVSRPLGRRNADCRVAGAERTRNAYRRGRLRLVYGGLDHEAPAAVTAELMTSLNELVPFDPLHLPGALAPGGEIGSAWPRAAQVVCFDTAFHRGKPEVAQRLLLPCEPWSRGVRRYGFHGFSYEFIVNELGDADGLDTFVYWRYRRTKIRWELAADHNTSALPPIQRATPPAQRSFPLTTIAPSFAYSPQTRTS